MALPTPPYFVYPFAVGATGNLASVPLGPTGGGTVTYNQGFQPGYSIPPGTSGSLPVPRTQMNQLFNDLQTAMQSVQQWGLSPFINAAQNVSANFPYSQFAQFLYDDGSSGAGARIFASTVAGYNTNAVTVPCAASKPYTTVGFRMLDFNANKMIFDNVSTSPGVTSAVTTYGSGCAVYFNGTHFDIAQATGGAPARMIGIYDAAFDRVYGTGSYYAGTYLGQSGGLSGLTAGSACFLSTATPGLITSTWSPVRVGMADSATSCYMNLQTSQQQIVRAHLSTGYTASTSVPLYFDTADVYVGSGYTPGSTGTGSSYTPPVAGNYRITVTVTGSTSGQRVFLNVAGTAVSSSNIAGISSVTAAVVLTDIVYLNGSQAVTFTVSNANALNGASGSAAFTYFSAELLNPN